MQKYIKIPEPYPHFVNKVPVYAAFLLYLQRVYTQSVTKRPAARKSCSRTGPDNTIIKDMKGKRIFIVATMLVCAMGGIMAQSDERKFLDRLLKKGAEAPDFVFENTADTLQGRALSSLRGRYVVLDFWASWCPDCRRDIPAMKRLHDRYASDSIVFVGVSFDKDREAWTKCVRDSGMTWTQHSELKPWKETEMTKRYNVEWIPTVYLIGPDGRVVTAALKADSIGKALKALTRHGSTGGNMARELAGTRFPGGYKALKSYLGKSLRYPAFAEKCKVKGVVRMKFTVNADGTVGDIEAKDCRITGYNKMQMERHTAAEQELIKKECLRQFAKEGYRVIKSMPKWEKAEDGKSVRIGLPLNFSMNVY